MENTRLIIAASGKSSRWGDYLGVPKFLAPVRGQPLLHRTIGQFAKKGINDIVIVSDHPDAGTAEFHSVHPGGTLLPNTGIGQSAPFWDPKKRNIITFGDVIFSNIAVNMITGCCMDGVQWFGRSQKSTAGGHGYQEMFAVSVHRDSLNYFRAAVHFIKHWRDENPCYAGGWLIYRAMQGINFIEHRITQNFHEINDETDDIDYPRDYDEWKIRNDKKGKLYD